MPITNYDIIEEWSPGLYMVRVLEDCEKRISKYKAGYVTFIRIDKEEADTKLKLQANDKAKSKEKAKSKANA